MERLLAPLAASAGLLGGFGIARFTHRRWAGGAALALGGDVAFALVRRRGGPIRAAVVAAAYLAAFGASHPLAKRLGAWPAVLAVAGATAVPAALLAAPLRSGGR